MEENGSIRFTPDSLICSDSSNGIRKLGNTGCQKAEQINTAGDKSPKIQSGLDDEGRIRTFEWQLERRSR